MRLLKSGMDSVRPFSTIFSPLEVSSISKVSQETMRQEVPATSILPDSWSRSWSWKAVEISLFSSAYPSPMVQIRARPFSARWSRTKA